MLIHRHQMGLFNNVLATNLTLSGVIMAFNLLSLVVALSFFILPLEKLAGRLRLGQKVGKESGCLLLGYR